MDQGTQRLVGIWILVIVTTNDAHRFLHDVTFDNRRPTSSYSALFVARSLIDCAVQCNLALECASFFYTQTSEECQLHDTLLEYQSYPGPVDDILNTSFFILLENGSPITVPITSTTVIPVSSAATTTTSAATALTTVGMQSSSTLLTPTVSTLTLTPQTSASTSTSILTPSVPSPSTSTPLPSTTTSTQKQTTTPTQQPITSSPMTSSTTQPASTTTPTQQPTTIITTTQATPPTTSTTQPQTTTPTQQQTTTTTSSTTSTQQPTTITTTTSMLTTSTTNLPTTTLPFIPTCPSAEKEWHPGWDGTNVFHFRLQTSIQENNPNSIMACTDSGFQLAKINTVQKMDFYRKFITSCPLINQYPSFFIEGELWRGVWQFTDGTPMPLDAGIFWVPPGPPTSGSETCPMLSKADSFYMTPSRCSNAMVVVCETYQPL